MTTVRVQAVFQGATLLPEDRFINTFHFHNASALDPYVTAAPGLAVQVQNFYLNTHNSRCIADLMSVFIIPEFKVVTYDLTLPEGEREPTEYVETMPTRTGDNLPEEVACCLTLHGASPITPRRRGRIYVGPLLHSPNVGDFDETATPTRTVLTGNQAIGTVLCQSAADLMAGADIPWCVRSITPSENFVPIVGGWVDNAFDIQRRRGPDPDARRTWSSADAGVS